jgi:CRISPR-associated protein Csd2
VLSTGDNLGVVRGPVQFVFSRSVDEIDSRTHSLTRCCVVDNADSTTFGNKLTVSYGLYRMHGYISAFDSEKCHFTEDDLKLLWEALINAFEHDHSAARGEMNSRALIVFKHASKLGNARSAQLFDLVKCQKKENVAFPRSFEDYQIVIEKDKLPAGVTIEEMI